MNTPLHTPGTDINRMVTMWAWENKSHEQGSEPRALKLFDALRRSAAAERKPRRMQHSLGQALVHWGRSLLHLSAKPVEKAAG